MQKYFYIMALLAIVLSASCASEKKTEKAGGSEIIIADDFTDKKGEVVIDGTDTEDIKAPVMTAQQSIKEAVKTAFDGSEISTMFDGFGNKTEIRTFSNNLLAQAVIARTFADGRRQIFVYGQNGEMRYLPVELYEKVLTAPGEYLAKSAGIFMGRKPRFSLLPEENTDAPQTILPTANFPLVKTPSEDEKPSTAVSEIINEKKIEAKTADSRAIVADLQNLELKTNRKKPQPDSESKIPVITLNAKNVSP